MALALLVGVVPAGVAELCVGLEGVGVLREAVIVGVIVGVMAEVAAPLNVVSEVCVVGDEAMIFVGVTDVVAGVSVEVRSVVAASDPVVSADVGVIVVVRVVGISELTEDGVMVVDVCMVSEVGADGVIVVVGVLPVEKLFEEVTPGVL